MLTSERLNDEKMEIRMKQRIAELEKANQALHAELLEHLHSKEALRKSEEKYRSLFNSIEEVFFLVEVIFDSKGKPVDCQILEANQSQEKVSGVEDVVGKRIRGLFPHTGEDWIKRLGQVVLTGNSVSFTEEIGNGNRWFEIRASRIGNEYSRKVDVLFKDIAKSKKAEEMLLNERARLKAIINTIPAGFLIIEADGQISVENKEAKRIWRGTIPLKSVSDYVKYKGYWPETGEQLKAEDWPASQALLYGRNVLGLEIDIERFDGTRGTVFFSAAPIKGIYGKTTGAVVILQDITERKLVEKSLHFAFEEIRVQAESLEAQTEELRVANEELSESEKSFRTLAQNSPDIIVRLDRKKFIRYTNPAIEEIYGRSPEEVIGKTPGELARYYRHLNFREKYYEKVLATGRTETVESQYVSPQGKQYYFSTKIVPEFVDGKVVSVLEISRDITEQKKIEKELKLARDYNRSLIEASLDPLVTIGHNGKITDTNKATELITGYSRDELIGTDFSDYFTESQRARKGYQYVFQKELIRDYPLEIRHKDGNITPVLYNATVYRSETGEVSGVFAAAHNFTEIKKARENIQSLANVVESSNDTIITESLTDIITSWNKGAEQIYGYLAEEALGKRMYILEPDSLKGEIEKLSEKIKNGKNVRHYETLRLRKDGTIVNISVTLSPVLDVSGKLVAISDIAGDITEKKIAEKLLHEKEIAEDASLTKSEFLANMSHELRTPLNSIIGFSDMLYEQIYGEMNKRQLKAVANVSSSGKHLLNLINSILDLSKIEAKKMELDCREFELAARLNLIRNILLPIADKKNITIELDIDDRLTRICADEDKFVRVMYNLVDNAMKFSYENGSVNIGARKKGDMVEITVKDKGIGIRSEDQHKLFKPFSQVDAFSSKKFQGAGLGLSLIKQIVHLHGGYVWFNSKIGEGSTFAFVIPIIADVKVHACCR